MRLYVVARIEEIEPLLSSAGKVMLSESRKDILNQRAIFCINHEPDHMRTLFADGVDYEDALSRCDIKTLEQVESLLKSATWATIAEFEADY